MSLNRLPLDPPGMEAEFGRIEVRRSARRKKTISAEVVGEALVVSLPDRMSRAEEQEWIARMARRLADRRRRERLNSGDDLACHARRLADRYVDGLVFAAIAWGGPWRTRWGWCDADQRSIHLSLAVADYPPWVRDYLIVHELAHLLVHDHSVRFWRLVNRYPLTERARGFLIAKGMVEGTGSD